MVEKPAAVEEVWNNFKECLIEEAIEVCGETRGREGTRNLGGGTKRLQLW